MAYRDLREFIGVLEKRGELARVKARVSPILEITQITDKLSKAGGPALLFESVEGSRMPVLMNAFGSERRMAMALGVESVEEIALEIAQLLKPEVPAGIVDKLKLVPLLWKLMNMPPKMVSSAPCQEVVREGDASLDDLPVLK